MTDIERDDALDHLTSEELETQAFGPEPTERRSIRGLIDRPASGGVVYRVQERKRRWPLVLGALAAFVVAFAAVDLAMGTGGGPDVFVMADGPDDPVVQPLSDAEAAAIEEALDAGTDPMEAQAAAREAAAEAFEEATDLGDGGVISDGPSIGDAVVAD